MEVLEDCKIDKAILFGHSDGGSIALIFAAKYPSKVGGIITEGAHIFVEDITLKGIRENYINLIIHEALKLQPSEKL